MAPRLTQAQKAMAYRLKSHGLSNMEIARQLSCDDSLILYMFQGKISSVALPRRGFLAPEHSPSTIENRSSWAFVLVTR